MYLFDKLNSVIGNIYILKRKDVEAISHIFIGEDDFHAFCSINNTTESNKDKLLTKAATQMNEYFCGERKIFELPLEYSGTPFQTEVWEALLEIPFGEIKSYYDIAMAIGKPKAQRAIGQANRKNDLPIVIPCHRVTRKNGELGGYAGNRTDIKKILLELEGHEIIDNYVKL